MTGPSRRSDLFLQANSLGTLRASVNSAVARKIDPPPPSPDHDVFTSSAIDIFVRMVVEEKGINRSIAQRMETLRTKFLAKNQTKTTNKNEPTTKQQHPPKNNKNKNKIKTIKKNSPQNNNKRKKEEAEAAIK